MRKDLGLLKEPFQEPKPKPPIATEDPFRPTPRHKRNALMPRTFMQRLATQAEEGSRDANNDLSLDASSAHLTISLDLSSPSGEHCPNIVSPVDAISKLSPSALHSLDEAQVWPQLSQIGAAGGRYHSDSHSSLSLDDHQMVMDYPDSIDGIVDSNPLWISSDNKEVAQQHAIGLPRDSSRCVTERGVVQPQREAAPLSTLPNAGVTQSSLGLYKFSPSSRWSLEKNPVQKPATALLASPRGQPIPTVASLSPTSMSTTLQTRQDMSTNSMRRSLTSFPATVPSTTLLTTSSSLPLLVLGPSSPTLIATAGEAPSIIRDSRFSSSRLSPAGAMPGYGVQPAADMMLGLASRRNDGAVSGHEKDMSSLPLTGRGLVVGADSTTKSTSLPQPEVDLRGEEVPYSSGRVENIMNRSPEAGVSSAGATVPSPAGRGRREDVMRALLGGSSFSQFSAQSRRGSGLEVSLAGGFRSPSSHLLKMASMRTPVYAGIDMKFASRSVGSSSKSPFSSVVLEN